MYEQFFGFSRIPFSKNISPENMYQSESFKELQKRFEYMLEYKGIMVISGASGVGKTSAIRYLLNTLSDNHYFFTYLPLSTVGVMDFYRQLNKHLNGDEAYHKSDVFKSIQNQIKNLAVHQNKLPVIILDEAHLLRDANIKELQIITNMECDSVDLAVYVLVGQPYLLSKLSTFNLSSFNQRITLKYELLPFSKTEMIHYITQNFKLCNVEEKIISEGAFEQIYKISKGHARIIGSLVIKALIFAAFEKKRMLESEDIVKVAGEIR